LEKVQKKETVVNRITGFILRPSKDTQWKIQQYAHASIELVKQRFIVAIECFHELQEEAVIDLDKLKALKENSKNN
jgi:thymidylate synthase ThyX